MPCNGQCFTVIQIHNLEEIIVMKYIESLCEGERINEIYLCKTKQSALTKAGKPYENVILQDKTGILDAKIWDPGSVGIDDFDSLDYVAVMGDITSFQGNLQLSIKRVRKVQEGEYDPKDYLPVSEKNIDEMYEELCVTASAYLRYVDEDRNYTQSRHLLNDYLNYLDYNRYKYKKTEDGIQLIDSQFDYYVGITQNGETRYLSNIKDIENYDSESF